MKRFLLLLSLGLLTTGCISPELNMYKKVMICVGDKTMREGTSTTEYSQERIEYCNTKYLPETGEE